MKKTYETPVAEKVEFQYQEQVVASTSCIKIVTYEANAQDLCFSDEKDFQYTNEV